MVLIRLCGWLQLYLSLQVTRVVCVAQPVLVGSTAAIMNLRDGSCLYDHFIYLLTVNG
jgi:hypothetical protein